MNALPDDIRTLLTAIRDTVELPVPDSYGDANERAYIRLLERRTQHLRAMLGAVLKTDGLSIGGIEQLIRGIAAETPVVYRTAPAAEDGAQPPARYRDANGTVWEHTGDREADGSPLYSEDGLTPVRRNNSVLHGLTVGEIEHGVGRLTPVPDAQEACDASQVSPLAAAPATEGEPHPVELTAARPCRTPWAHGPHDECAGVGTRAPATEDGAR